MFSQNKKWQTKHRTKKESLEIPKRVWIYVVLFVLCIIVVVYVLRLPEYQITDVVIDNAVITPEDTLKPIVTEYLGYKYFYIVPQSSVWLYPKRKMIADILKLPSITGVNIYTDSSRILHIGVKEKDNKFLWCHLENDCFYMNETGYIFAPAPQYEGNLFTVFKGSLEGDPVGKYFLTEEKMKYILDFIAKLEDLEIKVGSISVKSEHEVVLVLYSGTRLIITIDSGLADTYTNIKTLLESREFLEKSGGLEKIDYIDLRYGKKAFWKSRA